MKPDVICAAFPRQTRGTSSSAISLKATKPNLYRTRLRGAKSERASTPRGSADSRWRRIAPGWPVEGGWSLPNPRGFAGHTAWTSELISFSLVPNLPAVLRALALVLATVGLECKSHGAPLNYVVFLHWC